MNFLASAAVRLIAPVAQNGLVLKLAKIKKRIEKIDRKQRNLWKFDKSARATSVSFRKCPYFFISVNAGRKFGFFTFFVFEFLSLNLWNFQKMVQAPQNVLVLDNGGYSLKIGPTTSKSPRLELLFSKTDFSKIYWSKIKIWKSSASSRTQSSSRSRIGSGSTWGVNWRSALIDVDCSLCCLSSGDIWVRRFFYFQNRHLRKARNFQ